MFDRLVKVLDIARFRRDQRGSVLIVFVLTLIPAMMFIGVAIDYGQASRMKVRLQTATDEASVAAARFMTANPSSSEEEIYAYAKKHFDAAMKPDKAHLAPPILTNGRNRITFDASATYETMILKVAAAEEIDITTSATVDRGSGFLEVALVLDNTGSMAGGKIAALRQAATDLVNILEGVHSPERNVRIALVPFVTAVNVKGTGYRESWIDTEGKARYHGENFAPNADGTKVNHLSLFDRLRDTNGKAVAWKGCVEARPEPYDTSDTIPVRSNPDTLLVPYFWPDEPDVDQNGKSTINKKNPYDESRPYTNKYLDDQLDPDDEPTVQERQRSTAKYNTSNAALVDDTPSDTLGPNKACPTPIVPLTSDFNLLRSEISKMREWGGSGTNIAEGLAWGERVLSPQEPYTDGKPWGDVDVQKVVVLLTDGENVIHGQNTQTRGPTTHNRSDYSSVGYLAANRLGVTSPNEAKDVLLKKVGKICDSLKAKADGYDKEKAMVYTITFELNSNTLRTAFRACASRPDMYYDSPTQSRLREVFKEIALQIAALRIAK